MRKRILLAAWLLCGLMLPSWGQTESKKNPKLLIDGCFFMETPSELNGAKLKMAVLKNEDGRMMMLVTSCKKRSRLLQQKRRCCYSSDVAKLMFSS